MTDSTQQKPSHISVCVCTYKRSALLKRLLLELDRQITEGLFTYSIVIADNDEAKSAESLIKEMQQVLKIPIEYCVESRQNIALARNKVVENARGDYLAFIDDDEFPITTWLLTLFKACNAFDVDGVLGPVKRHFDQTPPKWMLKSKFYNRRVNPTGMQVEWQEARTGNVLLRRRVLDNDPMPFRPEFRAGEDQDFFRRKIESGYKFVWCAEAEAFEVVPPTRWKRIYLMRKALLRGATAGLQPSCGLISVMKSLIAIPLYFIALPVSVILGHHIFMTLMVKMCDHAGKLLILSGINPVRGEYVTE